MTFVEPTLWEHQKLGVSRSLASPRGFAFFYEMGCVAGDTLIRFNRNGKGFALTIADAYMQWKGLATTPVKWDLSRTTYVRSDIGERVGLNEVEAIVYSGVKEVFLLSLEDGKYLRATKDHKIMTKDGFVPLGSLCIGDEVLVDNVTKQSFGGRRLRAKKLACERDKLFYVHENHPYARRVRNGCRRQYVVEYHRALFEAQLNGLSLEQYKVAVRTRPGMLHFVDPSKYHIHHKDGNHFNNAVDNLEAVDKSGHLRHHSGGVGNFKHLGKTYSRVASITRDGMEATYDICCKSPHHSFVANGIVVHNSGKTLTVITALRKLFTATGRPMRTLIFCPQIVIANWADEINRFSRMGPLVQELRGSAKQRQALLEHPGKAIFVTNYETLDMEGVLWTRKGTSRIPRDIGFEVLVLDEAHRVKNGQAQRTKTLIKCRDVWKPAKTFLLTGTPILNTPLDIWAPYRIMDGGQTFTTSFVLFRSKYFENRNATAPSYVTWPDWQPREGCMEQVAQAIACSSHTVKKAECMDLPPLVEKKLLVELAPDQARDYHTMETDLVVQLRSGLLTAPLAVTKLLRLQQILSGAFQTDAGEIHQYKSNPRLEALKDLLEDMGGEKVIVWCPWAAAYPMLAKAIQGAGRQVVSITGKQNAAEKDAAVKAFRFGDADCVLANPGAAGTGVNLTEGRVAIWYSRTFNLEHRLQGMARNYRGGSEMHESVLSIDLVAPGTIDEKILAALDHKEEVGTNILEWAKRVLL